MTKLKLLEYDNKDVRWEKGFADKRKKAERVGYGFKTDKGIYLMRCPLCGRENYAPNVASGMCSWCEFDSNKEKTWEIL